MVQAIQNYYMLYLLAGLGVSILGILAVRRIMRNRDRADAEKLSDNENREEGKS